MDKSEDTEVDAALAVPDSVILKNDALFWDAFDSQREVIVKAGTQCVVADVSYKGGVPHSVIVEDYDPITNTSWIASLGAEDVKIIQKYST
jgi:hypothetical protein